MNTDDTLHIVEIPYDSGELRFRFARHLSDDGTHWIRHGWFIEFHRNGVIASEGEYRDDSEEGVWREYYENGVLAAEGKYQNGKEHGRWRFWAEDGTPEPDVVYFDGAVAPQSRDWGHEG